MASFSVPLLSICRGKLHRQVHVCDLLISYNHSPSTFTAVHPCIPSGGVGQLRILGLGTRLLWK